MLCFSDAAGQQFANCKNNKNHVINPRELRRTDVTSREWLSDVLKRSVIVIKSRAIVKCSSEETFGSLISKVAPEFQEERVKTKVLLIFQPAVSKVCLITSCVVHSSFMYVFIKL